LAVQLAGHDYLRGLGLDLVPASAPDFFVEDTPTAILVRQVPGAISQFEKATLVAKLKAARDRKRERTGKGAGRKNHPRSNLEWGGWPGGCGGSRATANGPCYATCRRRWRSAAISTSAACRSRRTALRAC